MLVWTINTLAVPTSSTVKHDSCDEKSMPIELFPALQNEQNQDKPSLFCIKVASGGTNIGDLFEHLVTRNRN